MSHSWKWGNKFKYRFFSGWLDVVRLKDSASICIDGEWADMFCDDALYFQNARQVDRACEWLFSKQRLTVRQAEQAGYYVLRGSYRGTTDDRIDRWYIVPMQGPCARIKGYKTRRAALAHLEEMLEGQAHGN